MNIIDYLKNESISCSCNQCQIQTSIPTYAVLIFIYSESYVTFEWGN